MEKDLIILVVPFAYEALILLRRFFEIKRDFLDHHKNVLFVFVNDKADTSRDMIFFEVFGENNPNAILLHNHKSNSIKAGAVYTGMAWALDNYPEAKKIGFVDMDDSIALESAYEAMLQVENFEAIPVLLSYRNQRAFLDGLASFGYSLFVKALFPIINKAKIKDLQNGFKCFSPDFLDSFYKNTVIVDLSFAFDMD